MLNYIVLESSKLIRNRHFWIIIALQVLLTSLYHGWFGRVTWFWRMWMFECRYDIFGILFIITLVYAYIVFKWRGALFIWVSTAMAMLPFLIIYKPFPLSITRNVFIGLIPLGVIITIAMEQRWRMIQKNISLQQEEQRRYYMVQILEAQENERRRIALELHDGVTQELLVVANLVQSLISDGDGSISVGEKQIGNINNKILSVCQDIQRLSHDLRPIILDNLGLLPAIRWLAGCLETESAIDSKVMVNGKETKLKSDVEVTIFRIVQEALNNVRRHSVATSVVINLNYSPDYLEVRIHDNGKGFSLNQAVAEAGNLSKLGLISIRERIKLLNGNFDIFTELNKGTTILAKIPI